jgi:hypothetical protein
MVCFLLAAMTVSAESLPADFEPYEIGTYPQQVQALIPGVPGPALAVSAPAEKGGAGYIGTEKGLYKGMGDSWDAVSGTEGLSVAAIAGLGEDVFAVAGGKLHRVGEKVETLADLPKGSDEKGGIALAVTEDGGTIYLGTSQGLSQWTKSGFAAVEGLNTHLGEGIEIRQIAIGPQGQIAVAARQGLFVKEGNSDWKRIDPTDEGGQTEQLLYDVRGASYAKDGTLWAATPRVIVSFGKNSAAFEKDQFPYNDFTCVEAGEGEVWFGTKIGAFRYDGKNWEYRQGKRWLAGDHVADIDLDEGGNAWFATDGGASVIETIPMTLAQKAAHYESLIDQYNRRTEYGYVLEAHFSKAGDLTSEKRNSDSDNDGLWTAMYGAGECFAYGATKDPEAKRRAKDAFEALRFLSVAPVGGEFPQQPGYVARTVVPTTEPDPNEQRGYRIEDMEEKRATDDSLWKVYFPRWVKTADGKYWYKTDTSSDELDGHYFFYPLYFDLVAETPEEKERVREVVRNITDHLVRNNFRLMDHDGTPTRWSDYSPENLNHNHLWYNERGLKSLSMLSYLYTAQHITGDPKYGEAITALRRDHAFDTNAMVTKIQSGIGSGNQSDDEMAIMCYYNLLKYADDPELLDEMTYSFYKYWTLEFPELNPLFNFAYAVFGIGYDYKNPWGTHDISPWEGWLEDSVDTLKRFPLDRFDWRHENSHRTDVVRLERQAAFEPYETPRRRGWNRGHLTSGKVLPVDERHFEHWNTDPWHLDQGGGGNGLADGAVYLLPYYMGLYHGFIVEK